MSSTGRGGERSPADFYATPKWCVTRLLEACQLPTGEWLEPAIGDGSIVRDTNEFYGARFGEIHWEGFDIRDTRDDIINIENLRRSCVTDFLVDNTHCHSNYEVAITNPPFSLAMEFIHKCRSIADHTVMLLRLNFLGSEERSKMMRETRPDLYILPNRPEFAMSVKCGEKPKCGYVITLPITEARPTRCAGCGGKVSIVTSDSIEYAWFHWHNDSEGKWIMLADTPLEERKAGQYGR